MRKIHPYILAMCKKIKGNMLMICNGAHKMKWEIVSLLIGSFNLVTKPKQETIHIHIRER